MSKLENGAALSRRNILRSATLVVGSAAVAAVCLRSAAAQSGKMSQKTAEYQNGPKSGQKCLDCSFYIQQGSCKLVDGTISPVGWCKFFAKKAS